MAEPEIRVGEYCKGLTPAMFLEPTVAAYFVWETFTTPSAEHFKVYDPQSGFLMRAGWDEELIFLERNGLRCEIQLPIAQRAGTFVGFGWTPERIFILAKLGATEEKIADTPTPFTVPPNELKKWWLEKLQFQEAQPYKTPQQILQTVQDALMAHRKRTFNNYQPYWDGDKPKPETHVHQTIADALAQFPGMKHIDINREVVVGTGKLDFLFSAHAESAGLGSVCMEVKASHSKELESGLRVQLPYYMGERGTSYGIYLVLDYGPGYRPAFAGNTAELDHWLQDIIEERKLPWGTVAVVLPVFRQLTPSELAKLSRRPDVSPAANKLIEAASESGFLVTNVAVESVDLVDPQGRASRVICWHSEKFYTRDGSFETSATAMIERLKR